MGKRKAAKQDATDVPIQENTYLPEGWRKCFSVRKKKFYFFHEESGRSSWTFPEDDSCPSATNPSEKTIASPSSDSKEGKTSCLTALSKILTKRRKSVKEQNESEQGDASPSKRPKPSSVPVEAATTSNSSSKPSVVRPGTAKRISRVVKKMRNKQVYAVQGNSPNQDQVKIEGQARTEGSINQGRFTPLVKAEAVEKSETQKKPSPQGRHVFSPPSKVKFEIKKKSPPKWKNQPTLKDQAQGQTSTKGQTVIPGQCFSKTPCTPQRRPISQSKRVLQSQPAPPSPSAIQSQMSISKSDVKSQSLPQGYSGSSTALDKSETLPSASSRVKSASALAPRTVNSKKESLFSYKDNLVKSKTKPPSLLDKKLNDVKAKLRKSTNNHTTSKAELSSPAIQLIDALPVPTNSSESQNKSKDINAKNAREKQFLPRQCIPALSKVAPKSKAIPSQPSTSSSPDMTSSSEAEAALSAFRIPKKSDSLMDVEESTVEELPVAPIRPLSEAYEDVIKAWRQQNQGREEEDMDLEESFSVDLLANRPFNKSVPHGGTFVVVDTNILMGDLKYFKLLLREEQPRVGYVTVVVPWTVFQELDGIKMNRMRKKSKSPTFSTQNNTEALTSLPVILPTEGQVKAEHAKFSAAKAIEVLNKQLEARHPRLVAQTPTQCRESAKLPDSVPVEMNDDKMLNCCLQWTSMHQDKRVFFLTNDKHLRSKALVTGVSAYSAQSLPVFFEQLISAEGRGGSDTDPGSSQQDGACSSLRNSARLVQAHAANNPGYMMDFASGSDQMFSTIQGNSASDSHISPLLRKSPSPLNSPPGKTISEKEFSLEVWEALEEGLTPAFSHMIEAEMKDVYGNLWLELVFKKPPWTFVSALQTIRKHWIAVFGMKYERSLSNRVDSLFTHHRDRHRNDHRCLAIVMRSIRAADDLFEGFSSESRHKQNAAVMAAIQLLNQLHDVIDGLDRNAIEPLEKELEYFRAGDNYKSLKSAGNEINQPAFSEVSNTTMCSAFVPNSPVYVTDIPPAVYSPPQREVSSPNITVNINMPPGGTNLQSPGVPQSPDSTQHGNPVQFQVLGRRVTQCAAEMYGRLGGSAAGSCGQERTQLLQDLAVLISQLLMLHGSYQRMFSSGVNLENAVAMCRVVNEFAAKINIQDWQPLQEVEVTSFFTHAPGDARAGEQELGGLVRSMQCFNQVLSAEEMRHIEDFTRGSAS